MKILHIAGWSGSGKTTFILKLCNHLNSLGKTATIKHIGSHYSILPLGKDTTVHYQSGADPAIGIDEEKTSACFHSVDLAHALNLLSDSGVRYAIIEGFKKWPFQKVLIGDLDCAYLLKNPDVSDVMEILDQFDDWYTLSGLHQELGDQFPDDHIFTWTGYSHTYQEASDLCKNIEEEIFQDTRISGIRLRIQKWPVNSRYPIFLVLSAKSPDEAVNILSLFVYRFNPFLILR